MQFRSNVCFGHTLFQCSSTLGPVVMDDIYNGETYNASMETAGWTEAGYDSATNGWTAVKESVPGST